MLALICIWYALVPFPGRDDGRARERDRGKAAVRPCGKGRKKHIDQSLTLGEKHQLTGSLIWAKVEWNLNLQRGWLWSSSWWASPWWPLWRWSPTRRRQTGDGSTGQEKLHFPKSCESDSFLQSKMLIDGHLKVQFWGGSFGNSQTG